MRSANFVEESVTSIAGTNGDGAATLAQIAGMPRLSHAFGTQATTFRYVMGDVTGKKFESGIGTVEANVLTRTRPQNTWDGTTWSAGASGAVQPLQFGSTPVAGSILVRIAPLAEAQGPVMPQVQSLLGNDPFRDYPFCAAFSYTANNGIGYAIVANTIHYDIYKLDRAGRLQGFQMQIGTAGGTGIKVALYSVGVDGLPDRKIVDFNVIPSETSGVKTDTASATWLPANPINLTPGWYVIAFISDGAPQVWGNAGTGFGMTPTPFGRSGGYGYGHLITVAGSYATGLPAIASCVGGTLNTQNIHYWTGIKVLA